MTFFCDRCGQPLLLEGPASAGLRVQCPSCLATLDVPAPAEEAPTEPSWFAMVRGSQVGPMGLGPLGALVRAGEITGKTFLWCEGMAEWRRAEGLPELGGLLAATRPPKPANTADLSQLFSDLDLTVSRPMEARAVEQMLAGKRRPQPVVRHGVTGVYRHQTADDEVDSRPYRFRRHSPWKIAAAILLALVLPVAGLYALSTLQVVPLEVSRVDEATGAEVKEPVFSAKGARGLKDLLLGKSPAAPGAPREASRPPARRPDAPKPAELASAKAAPVERPASPQLKALYGEGTRQDIAPQARALAPRPTPSGAGPDSPALSRVVSQSSPAFQFCIEQQLKKNPRFRGGKINLLATIGPSGVVKQARVDRKDIDSSDLGDCLKSKARRLVFPPFSGEDVEVQIPLVLTATL